MPIQIQPISFTPGAVQQGKGSRHIPLGDLIEALNVRLVKESQYRKRPGMDRLVPTTDSGSFTGPADSLVSDGKRLIALDAADMAWAYDSAANKYLARGRQERAYPEISNAPVVPNAKRPATVSAGGYYWTFIVGTSEYRWMMWDPVTRTVFRQFTTQAATNITQLTAVQDGTNVWVIWLDGTTTVRSHKFVIATPGTAPTSATYQTVSTAASAVDAYRMTTTGEIAVVVSQVVAAGGTTWRYNTSYLNTSNGQAKTSPAAVETTVTGNAYDNNHSPVSILQGQSGSANWYFAIWTGSATGNSVDARLIEVNVSTLAVASTVVLDTVTNAGAPNSNMAAWICGFRDGNGDRYVYATFDEYNNTGGAPAKPRPYVLKRHVRTGSTTTTTLRRYSYPVSKPVQLGSSWYLLTGYDDAVDFQRSYYLIDSAGRIVSQIAYPFAVGAGQGNGQLTSATTDLQGFVVDAMQTQANRVDFVPLTNPGGGSTTDFSPALISCDFAATFSVPAKQRDGAIVVPAGVPTRAGISDSLRELVPMLFPPPVVFTNNGGALAGPSVLHVTYQLIDADGTVYMSSPSAAQSNTFGAGANTIAVKPLTHMLDGTTAQIVVWLSDPNSTTPFLYTVVANDPTVDTQTINIPNPATVPPNDILYTFGGGLSNAPAPSVRWVATWRNRTFLGSGNDIWYSHEHEIGQGPRFNEILRSRWEDGEGDTIAGGRIDRNSFAIFKRDRIGVISGPGPDGLGRGNYEVQTLEWQKGIINARSIVSGPAGCFFQALSDGRIYCATPGLQIADVWHGMEDFRTETVTAAVLVEKEREIQFHTNGPRMLVLDYAHATAEQPFGRWFTRSSANLLQGFGAAVDPSGVTYHIETNGVLRKPGTGWSDAGSGAAVAVLMRLKSGDLAAAGALNAAFRLDAIHLLGQFLGAHTLKLTVVTDGGTDSDDASKAVSAGPQLHTFFPALPDEIGSVQLTIEESANAGATEGFIFDGITLDVQAYARSRFPRSAAGRF